MTTKVEIDFAVEVMLKALFDPRAIDGLLEYASQELDISPGLLAWGFKERFPHGPESAFAERNKQNPILRALEVAQEMAKTHASSDTIPAAASKSSVVDHLGHKHIVSYFEKTSPEWTIHLVRVHDLAHIEYIMHGLKGRTVKLLDKR